MKKLHKDIIKLIEDNDIMSDVAFFCRNREIAEAFTNYIYNEYNINFFLDVEDCMCYSIWGERSFYVADTNQHKNYELINVYLEN